MSAGAAPPSMDKLYGAEAIEAAKAVEQHGSAASSKPKLMLLLRSLDRGGAERQAVTLACALKARGWPVVVACFYGGGAFARGLQSSGVSLIDLGKRGRWDIIGFMFRLWRVLRAERPQILHSYLPVPNLVAIAMRWLFPGMRVVWGVRASNLDLRHYGWLSRLSYWLERRFSRQADLIIANSESGARLRIAQGFPSEAVKVIPNGIDTDRFCFDAEARKSLRLEWGVPEGATLVGLVARLDPMKDHQNFLTAAAELAAKDKHWHFACVGDGPTAYKAELVAQANASGVRDRLIWAGARDDMAAVYSALDIAASASSGEGFPNVIAEAMACGRPCVVTDVGDSALIVGELGVVVSPRTPIELVAGVERLQKRIGAEGGALAISCRERVVARFSVKHLEQDTEAVLLAICQAGAEAS